MQGAMKPQTVRFFRGQMQTIISRALADLDIKPVPSRRCFTLIGVRLLRASYAVNAPCHCTSCLSGPYLALIWPSMGESNQAGCCLHSSKCSALRWLTPYTDLAQTTRQCCQDGFASAGSKSIYPQCARVAVGKAGGGCSFTHWHCALNQACWRRG